MKYIKCFFEKKKYKQPCIGFVTKTCEKSVLILLSGKNAFVTLKRVYTPCNEKQRVYNALYKDDVSVSRGSFSIRRLALCSFRTRSKALFSHLCKGIV